MAEKKKVNWRIALIYYFIAGFVGFLIITLMLGSLEHLEKPPERDVEHRVRADPNARDAIIVSAISQIRTVMISIYRNKGNYDSFNCKEEDMVPLCHEIDKNYGKDDDREPVIVHDVPINSQGACIYSPLNEKKNYWYCADSTGIADFTSTDPGGSGYCVEGESAVCPSTFEPVL